MLPGRTQADELGVRARETRPAAVVTTQLRCHSVHVAVLFSSARERRTLRGAPVRSGAVAVRELERSSNAEQLAALLATGVTGLLLFALHLLLSV